MIKIRKLLCKIGWHDTFIKTTYGLDICKCRRCPYEVRFFTNNKRPPPTYHKCIRGHDHDSLGDAMACDIALY